MNLVKRNNSSSNLFPALMEEFFRPDWMGGSQNLNTLTVPPVNIRETETTFEVELSAPGFNKDIFQIEIDNDLLSISAEIKTENTTEEEGKFTRREFSSSSFKRSFKLPETVNQDEINAGYENGILRVTLPKREEALPKPKRSISIS
ncbi:MAG: Hsp20/alpha crystallin family protein [Flavobacterium sp.]|nr:Hsp20/alpha crystallin family protein [Flavobacterium sp.]